MSVLIITDSEDRAKQDCHGRDGLRDQAPKISPAPDLTDHHDEGGNCRQYDDGDPLQNIINLVSHA